MIRFKGVLFGVVFIGFLSSCQHVSTSRHAENFKEADQLTGYYSGKGDRQALTQKIDYQNQPRKRTWVLNFWNDTPVKFDSFGTYAGDELRRGLVLSDRVVYPTDVREGLTTESFVEGEQVKVEQLVREARRVGASVAMIGRIRKIVFRQKGDEIGLFRKKQSLVAVELEVKSFDVQQGKEILASSKYGEANADNLVIADDQKLEGVPFKSELIKLALREALAGFIPELASSIDKMKWQGRIAKIQGSKYYLNAGLKTGLMNGDILTVMTSGEDVFDPETGASLGRSAGRLKGTLEVVDQLGADASVARIHTGGNFAEGDSIQLY